MNLPIFLSVSKATARMNAVVGRNRQLSSDEQKYVAKIAPLFRPFCAAWFFLLAACRFIPLFGWRVVLFVAWTSRIAVVIFAVTAIAIIIAVIYNASNLPHYSGSTYAAGQSSTSGASSSEGTITDSPVHTSPQVTTYGHATPSPPTSASPSSFADALQDPTVQQNVLEVVSWVLEAWQHRSAAKPVHVQSYQRQDGTQVRDYNRSLPNR